MKGHYILTGAILVTSVIGAPALAQNCAKREIVVERLQKHYDESFTAGGLQSTTTSSALVEVWASAKTGTFTVMLTTPEGLTCVVATGTDWHQQAQVATPDGTDS